jgi:hypothetical protein
MMVHIEPRIAVAISTKYHYLPRWNLSPYSYISPTGKRKPERELGVPILWLIIEGFQME